MKFSGKQRPSSEVPTASMPDIVFMLLIFFMVTTVFKEFRGMQISLPSAKQIEKLEGKRNVAYLWVDKKGRIMVDDYLINLNDVDDKIYEKLVKNPRIVISLKIDKGTEMKIINDVQNKLREVEALRINYASLTKS